MIDHLPWDDITTPEADFNVRSVADCGSVPLLYGKDSRGRLLALVELDHDCQDAFFRKKPEVKGLNLELRTKPESTSQNMVIALQKEVDRDIFTYLCRSLFAKLRRAQNSRIALETAFNHLARWQAFMASKSRALLSPEKYRGLWSELFYLDALLKRHKNRFDVIGAWTGADYMAQDFIYAGKAVEIKSLYGGERNTVDISSEDQLESSLEFLYLVCINLAEAPASGISLNTLVSEIISSLDTNLEISFFENKLEQYGYLPLPEYDEPCLIAENTRSYIVTNNFPRLARSNLPAAISKVHYKIALDRLDNFECELSPILDDIK